MKKNLFLSICSLLVTTFLLFFLVVGWYVSNTEVSANGIFGTTAGDDYEVHLKRAEVNEGGNILGFVDTKNLSLTGLEPNSIFIFSLTIKAKGSENVNLALSFNEIESILNSDKLVVENNILYRSVDNIKIPLYTLSNGEIRITEDGGSSKLLYSYDGAKLSLGDYLIEDTFKAYDLGKVVPTTNKINKANGAPLKDANMNIVASNTEETYYFALEFNEDLANKAIGGFISSNLYLYQSLKIGRISLEKI